MGGGLATRCGSFEQETSGSASRPLDPDDVSGSFFLFQFLVFRRPCADRSSGKHPNRWLPRLDRGMFQASSLQKKCLMAGEPERPCFVTRGMKEAIWQVRLRAPFSSARLAPRPDGPLTHFTSPRGETCRLPRRARFSGGGLCRGVRLSACLQRRQGLHSQSRSRSRSNIGEAP